MNASPWPAPKPGTGYGFVGNGGVALWGYAAAVRECASYQRGHQTGYAEGYVDATAAIWSAKRRYRVDL